MVRGRSVVLALIAAAAVAAPLGALAAADAGSTAPVHAAGVTSSNGVEPASAAAAPRYGTYAWPVQGPVVRRFEPPETTFGTGHRGIDIAVPLGTPVAASAAGVVAFAGPVAGGLFVSIDHPDGVRTTYSWLSRIDVARGDRVERRAVIGATGAGHPGGASPHLHFGARVGETYIDPMLLLERGSLVGLVHLAPLERDGA